MCVVMNKHFASSFVNGSATGLPVPIQALRMLNECIEQGTGYRTRMELVRLRGSRDRDGQGTREWCASLARA